MQLKATVLELVQQIRAKEKAEPGWASQAFPAEPFDATKPTRFVYNELFRRIAQEQGQTLTPNDGVDLFHSIVASAYSDIVLLDKKWAKRVRALGLPVNRARTYYEGELPEFFKIFEKGTIAVPQWSGRGPIWRSPLRRAGIALVIALGLMLLAKYLSDGP